MHNLQKPGLVITLLAVSLYGCLGEPTGVIVTQTTTATKEISKPTAATSPTPTILNPTATYPVVTVYPDFISMAEAIEAGIALCTGFRFSVKGSPEIVQVKLTTFKAARDHIGDQTEQPGPDDLPVWWIRLKGKFILHGPPPAAGEEQFTQEYSGCDALVDACTGHAFYMRGMF